MSPHAGLHGSAAKTPRRQGGSEPRPSAAGLTAWRLGGSLCLLLWSGSAIAEDSTSPPLAPLPRTVPLLPSDQLPSKSTPEERFQRRLEELVRERDGRIRTLLDSDNSLSTQHLPPRGPGLLLPGKERDQARADLQRALEAFDERSSKTRKDVLDVARPAAQSAQQSTLAATNLVRLAECYHDLASAGQATAQDLRDGHEAVARLTTDDLGEADRPRMLYLRAWFLAERARQASGDEQSKLADEARASAQALRQAHPTSDLVPAIDAALTGLPAAAPKP